MPKKPDPLESWHALQDQIHGLSEAELQKLIDRELEGSRRRNMVLRIHMKLNKLRYAREKAAYKKKTIMLRGKDA
jgi:hypothetical protein